MSTYEAWRATFQDAEAAAKAAFEQAQGLAKMVDGLQAALGLQVRFGSDAGNQASGAQDKMSTTQPEALRLAELIRLSGVLPGSVSDDAVSELRRLHAENQDLRTRHYCNTAEIESLQHRVQELGEMARENRSKKVIELEGRIAEMEEQMAAIGAGGVEPLRKRADAAPQAVQAAVPQIDWESAAEKIAIEVADNCGTVPNITHPHIYLGLKKLFATAPVVSDAQIKAADAKRGEQQ